MMKWITRVSHAPNTMRNVARGTLWASVAVNVWTLGDSLWRHQAAVAGLETVILVVLTTWGWFAPKLDAWLDFRIVEAEAQQQMTDVALAELRRQVRAGDLQVQVRAESAGERRH